MTIVQEPKTYTKRIYAALCTTGARVSLYVVIIDSVAESYFITMDSKRVAEYRRKDAALERVKRLQAGEDDVPAPVRIEDWAEVAQDILAGRVTSPVPPTLQVLCAVTMALLRAKERTERHAGWCETVARCLGKQTVPTERQEFSVWLDQMTVKLAEGVRKKSTLDLRLKMFASCLKTALMFPTVFPDLCDIVGSVSERVRAKRSMLSVGRLRMESRTAMTASEVLYGLGQCGTVEEKAFYVLCLATGLRAGEANRLRVEHLTYDGCIDLSKVQTKTNTKRLPKAAVVVRAILKTFEPPWQEASIKGFDRRRFRPTCATMLGLASVPTLRICERLGHTNTTMVEKHYSKAPPADMAGRDIETYLDIGDLAVGGVVVEENAFDRWCLLLGLTAVSGTPWAEKLKAAVLSEIGAGTVAKPRARVF